MKLKTYLNTRIRKNSQRTYTSILNGFEAWLKTKRKKLDNAEYTDEDVHEYLEALRKRNGKKWKRSAKNTALTVIKGFARFQIDRIDIGTNLEDIQLERKIQQRLRNVINMKKYVEPEPEPLALDIPDIKKVLEKASKEHYPIFLCYFALGVRKMELPTMRKIDLKNRSVVFTTLKNKTRVGSRKLFYPKFMDDIMRGISEGTIRIKYRRSNYEYIFKKYRGHFKTRFIPLSTRHTFRTHMMNSINDEPLVRRLMGHKVAGAAGHYDEVFDREKKKAMQKDHYLIKEGVISA